MDAIRRRHWTEVQKEALAARRRRVAEVPIEERLLETVAWSATLLADDLRRTGRGREHALPVGLGRRST
ncbi:MAG: hypothetical protein HY899_04390 [Deltaproteobacteria bacterium]|nr:hypothetical protein [Deltaproteobacteria bacterium]